MSDLAFLSATELASLISTRKLSSEELLRHYLERVDRYNPEINAIVVASDLPHRVIRVGDNLVARLLFWPLLSFALLLATLMIFR